MRACLTAIGIVSFGLAGCRQQVFEPVRNALVATAVIEGDVRVTTRADLLFVVDDSPSMANEQQKLAQGFPALVSALDALDPPIDYRVAILTSSVSERFGPCDVAVPGAATGCDAMFGGTGFRCDGGDCLRDWPQAGLPASWPGGATFVERAKTTAAGLSQAFAATILVGTRGARQEQPLRAVSLALESGSLASFLRPDARLVTVVTSDEDDCSDSTGRFLALEAGAGRFTDRCAEAASGGLAGLDETGAWLRAMRSRHPLFTLGAVVGLVSGTTRPGRCVDAACAAACNAPAGQQRCRGECAGALQTGLCESECLGQCVSFCGADVPGTRLARTALASGGSVASICDSDYGPSLAKLARVLGVPTEIELPSLPADERSLYFEVKRSGGTVRCTAPDDVVVDQTRSPPVAVIRPQGRCALAPDDHWTLRYLTAP
jgi:hypothetical protein